MTRKNTPTRSPRRLLSLSALALIATASVLFAGPLDPPAGPVTSTYKTLTEVEPRIAINATNTPGDADSLFKITQRGSYYLTGNITGVVGKHGIEIVASGVTLDLNGFDLVGVPAMGAFDGVSVTVVSLTNIAVVNGSIRTWGGEGVDLGISPASNCRVERVHASGNAGNGISVGNGCTVTNCSASNNTGGHGINVNGAHGVVAGCTANANSMSGIRAANRALVRDCATGQNVQDNILVGGSSSVINCIANNSTAGHGINASFTNSLVQGCTAVANALSGVRASQRTRVQGCVCSSNTLHGVHATFAGAVEDCFINQNGGDGVLVDAGGVVTIRNNTISESSGVGDAGIRVTIGGCHIEGNSVTICNTGILVATDRNTVIRNSAIANTTNFNIAAGNTAGPVITPATAAAATNPLANYSN